MRGTLSLGFSVAWCRAQSFGSLLFTVQSMSAGRKFKFLCSSLPQGYPHVTISGYMVPSDASSNAAEVSCTLVALALMLLALTGSYAVAEKARGRHRIDVLASWV